MSAIINEIERMKDSMTVEEVDDAYKTATTYITWASAYVGKFSTEESYEYILGMILLAEVIKPIYENHNGGRDDEGTVGA